MREFTTVETYTVTGRGTAHTVYVGESAPQCGEYVQLDGALRKVTGVEWPITKAGYTAVLVASVSDA